MFLTLCKLWCENLKLYYSYVSVAYLGVNLSPIPLLIGFSRWTWAFRCYVRKGRCQIGANWRHTRPQWEVLGTRKQTCWHQRTIQQVRSNSYEEMSEKSMETSSGLQVSNLGCYRKGLVIKVYPRSPRSGKLGQQKRKVFKNGRESPWDSARNKPVLLRIRMLVSDWAQKIFQCAQSKASM